MRDSLRLVRNAFLAAICAGAALSATAASIYDNSVNDLVTRLNPGAYEVGDEVNFAGSERFLTQFDFEYYGLSSTAGVFAGANVEARVRFYLNDGAPYNGYARPSTVFYDTGWFGGFAPTVRNTISLSSGVDFPTGGLYIPANTITWSVQFQGLGAGDVAGVDIYDPPVVGTSANDYWEKNGSWTLRAFGEPGNQLPANFASRFFAVVPEPSVTALLLLGCIGYAGFLRRNRRED